jgi:predicted peptidase
MQLSWNIMATRNRLPEFLLLLSVFTLGLQVSYPSLVNWWRRPRPGRIGVAFIEAKSGHDTLLNDLAESYLLFLPDNHSSKEWWPLAIFLHGSGGSGNNIEILWNDVPIESMCAAAHNKFVIAVPQCRTGRNWNPASVKDFLEQVSTAYKGDKERIYLLGFSMGAFGTWAAVEAHPNLYAAAIPIAGGGDSQHIANAVRIPIWAFHGAKDRAVPPNESFKLVESLQLKGGRAGLTILPDAGHQIAGEVCKDERIWQWLLEQKLTDQQ